MSSADFILVNARIWSVGLPGDPDCLVARNGRTLAVGRYRDLKSMVAENAVTLDACGRRVLPGLCDAHLHLIPSGLRLQQIDLGNVADRNDFTRQVAEFAATHTNSPWLLGGGWSSDHWSDHADPSREWIDAVTGDRPAWFYRLDCHAGLANTAALRLAGIDRHGPASPGGGEIVRNSDGEPTGVLRDTAMALVVDCIPEPTAEQRAEALRSASAELNRLGITMVHNMLDPPDIETVLTARRDHTLSLRMFNIIHRRPDRGGLTNAPRLARDDEWLSCGACKNYIDGSLGSRTAWMLHSYLHAAGPHPTGLRVDGGEASDDLAAEFRRADAAGLQLCTHAIGDAACRELLRLYRDVVGLRGDRRPRVEHAQHIDPADIRRFAETGAVASMQPIHKFDDGGYAHQALGTDRARFAYPFRTLRNAGVVLAFGSDWPIAPPDPFRGIDAAVTGRTRDGSFWLTEQNLSLRAALEAYTTGPAYACRMEQRVGRLLPGYCADLIVLDRDILSEPIDAIRDTQVTATVVNGRVVCQA